jgi:cobalt-zinc-cadmium efflux system protein
MPWADLEHSSDHSNTAIPEPLGRPRLLIDLAVPSRNAERRLWIALVISSAIVVIEFTGGFLGHSLALLGDSGHVLTDVLGIGVSILTLRLGRLHHTAKRTFGYHRAEIFAALVNGSTLIAVALLIIYEAFLRFQQPTQVQGPLVLSFASLGLIGNLTTTGLLARTRKTSLNVRGVFLHAAGDTVSSIAVIVSSLVVVFAGYSGLDPVAAVLIGILIMRSAYGLVRDSTNILLEATPRHLQLENIAETIRSVNGVKEVHDLHVWTITSGLYALSGHVTVDSETIGQGSVILEKVAVKLKESFGIEHVTLQMEKETLENIEHESSTL